MSDKRLLVISIDALPMIGGVSNFAHNCANEFSKLCSETFFLGPKGSHIPSHFKKDYKLIVDEDSRPKIRSGAAYRKDITRIETMLKNIIEKHDINRLLLFHPFYYGEPATKIAKKMDLECDIVVHGTELSSQFPTIIKADDTLGPINVDSLPFHLFSALNNSTRIVANSNFTATLANRIATQTPSIVCGCGMNEDALNELDKYRNTQTKHKDIKHQSAIQLCYVGRLVAHKCIENIFPLLRKLNAYLTIIGDGPMKKQLSSMINDQGLKDKVHFAGVVSDEQKHLIISKSDFLMLPSRYSQLTGGYEGFGIVILEAIALGTIPISSGHDGMSDPVHSYKLGIEGLSQKFGVNETAQVIKTYKNDAQKYNEKVKLDLQIIRKKLLWSNVVERISKGWSHEK